MNPYESPTHCKDGQYRRTWATLAEDVWCIFRDLFTWESACHLFWVVLITFPVGIGVIYLCETSPLMQRVRYEIDKTIRPKRISSNAVNTCVLRSHESALSVTKTTPLFQQRGLTTCSEKENEMADESVAVEYREVPGYPLYRAGSDGTVWSRNGKGSTDWKEMKGTVEASGYCRVKLRKDGKVIRCWRHRLVLEAFVGSCPEGMEVRHFPDSNPLNNALANLQWGTKKENQADRVFHGTDSRGENNGSSVLSAESVLEIRTKRADGASLEVLASTYGVTPATTSIIGDRTKCPSVLELLFKQFATSPRGESEKTFFRKKR